MQIGPMNQPRPNHGPRLSAFFVAAKGVVGNVNACEATRKQASGRDNRVQTFRALNDNQGLTALCAGVTWWGRGPVDRLRSYVDVWPHMPACPSGSVQDLAVADDSSSPRRTTAQVGAAARVPTMGRRVTSNSARDRSRRPGMAAGDIAKIATRHADGSWKSATSRLAVIGLRRRRNVGGRALFAGGSDAEASSSRRRSCSTIGDRHWRKSVLESPPPKAARSKK